MRAQSGFGEAGIEPGTTFRARASLKTRIVVILSTFVFSLYSIQFRYSISDQTADFIAQGVHRIHKYIYTVLVLKGIIYLKKIMSTLET